MPSPLPLDYDSHPERYRAGLHVGRAYSLIGDLHQSVSARLAREGATPVLDVGCGSGVLAPFLAGAGLRWIGLDLSAVMLADAPRPVVRADALELPLADASVGAVAALYMLYHLAEPLRAITQAARVLRPGGLFVAAAPSRHDAPELSHLLPPWTPTTFDAETAADLIGRVFHDLEVQAWDAPALRLPGADALRDYLIGHGLSPSLAAERSHAVTFPVTITKRGALVYARKPLGT